MQRLVAQERDRMTRLHQEQIALETTFLQHVADDDEKEAMQVLQRIVALDNDMYGRSRQHLGKSATPTVSVNEALRALWPSPPVGAQAPSASSIAKLRAEYEARLQRTEEALRRMERRLRSTETREVDTLLELLSRAEEALGVFNETSAALFDTKNPTHREMYRMTVEMNYATQQHARDRLWPRVASLVEDADLPPIQNYEGIRTGVPNDRLRALLFNTAFSPAELVQTYALTQAAVQAHGIVYTVTKAFLDKALENPSLKRDFTLDVVHILNSEIQQRSAAGAETVDLQYVKTLRTWHLDPRYGATSPFASDSKSTTVPDPRGALTVPGAELAVRMELVMALTLVYIVRGTYLGTGTGSLRSLTQYRPYFALQAGYDELVASARSAAGNTARWRFPRVESMQLFTDALAPFAEALAKLPLPGDSLTTILDFYREALVRVVTGFDGGVVGLVGTVEDGDGEADGEEGEEREANVEGFIRFAGSGGTPLPLTALSVCNVIDARGLSYTRFLRIANAQWEESGKATEAWRQVDTLFLPADPTSLQLISDNALQGVLLLHAYITRSSYGGEKEIAEQKARAVAFAPVFETTVEQRTMGLMNLNTYSLVSVRTASLDNAPVFMFSLFGDYGEVNAQILQRASTVKRELLIRVYGLKAGVGYKPDDIVERESDVAVAIGRYVLGTAAVTQKRLASINIDTPLEGGGGDTGEEPLNVTL